MRTIKNSILKVPRVERLIHGHLEIRYWAGPFQSWGCFISWWMNIYLLWRSLYAYVHIHAHIRTYALILKNIWNGCKWTMKKHRMKNKCEETKQKGLTDIMDNMFFLWFPERTMNNNGWLGIIWCVSSGKKPSNNTNLSTTKNLFPFSIGI